MKILDHIITFILSIIMVSCSSIAENKSKSKVKINGVSYAASKVLIDSIDLTTIKNIDAGWIALMPYAFINEGGVQLNYNASWQWKGESLEGITREIKICHQLGLKVMLKPHVWISHGEYTGDFMLNSDSNWVKFENSYSEYMLEFAAIAEEQHAELFCIGTEWRLFVKERPAYWSKLIMDIRKVYTGKLTYASNWDEYTETPFWRELDFIGVNAYFPITKKENPTIEEVLQGWEPITEQLKSFSVEHEKPILFTEYGYRSIEGTTIEPWVSDTKAVVSMKEQSLALEGLYISNWKEDWLAGGFLWKWFNNENKPRDGNQLGFTPQKKPAQLVVKKYYEIED